MGAAPVVPQSPIDDWMVDSGASYDSVLKRDVAHLRFVKAIIPLDLSSAAGIIRATHKCNLYIPQLQQTLSPWVLDDSPNLLSMGSGSFRDTTLFGRGSAGQFLSFPRGIE